VIFVTLILERSDCVFGHNCRVTCVGISVCEDGTFSYNCMVICVGLISEYEDGTFDNVQLYSDLCNYDIISECEDKTFNFNCMVTFVIIILLQDVRTGLLVTTVW
jgi:hypothetical protein